MKLHLIVECFSKKKHTHEIKCSSSCAIDWISNTEIDLSKFHFKSVVNRAGEWFAVCLPFDHMLFSERGAVNGDYLQIVIPRSQLEFSAQEIKTNTPPIEKLN